MTTVLSPPATVADVLFRAGNVVAHYGHTIGRFGCPATGFSVEGAVYRVARLLLPDTDGVWRLEDPTGPDDVDFFARWGLCLDAFVVLAEVLHRPVVRREQAFAVVSSANDDLDVEAAVEVLFEAARRAQAAS